MNSSVEMEDCGADSIGIGVLDIYCIKSNEMKRPQDLTMISVSYQVRGVYEYDCFRAPKGAVSISRNGSSLFDVSVH